MHKQKLNAGILIFAIVLGLLAGSFWLGNANAQSTVPVGGAKITASGPGGIGRTLTDSQGHFTITNALGTGTYSITARLQGYVATSVNNVKVTAGAETSNVTILMQLSGVLAGKVTDSSTRLPIQSVYVTAYNSSGTFQLGSTALTDASGDYRIATDLSTGTYTVVAHYAADHLSETVSGVSISSGNVTTIVNFALNTSGVIAGVITDSVSSSPLPSITVEAIDAYGNIACVSHTDSSGGYSLDNNLPTGIYQVATVTPMEHAPKTVAGINVTAGSTTALNLNLDPSGIISGKVTSSTGQPIPGASITASSGSFVVNGTSDSDGNYRIADGLGAGSYSVSALSGLISNQVTGVSVVKGEESSNVNIVLAIPPSGTVTGKVTDSTGNPISYATVNADGSAGSGSTVTDADGNYALTDLPAGSYKVTASTTGFESASQNSVTVTANTVASNVNFDLSAVPTGTISGVVIVSEAPIPVQSEPNPEQSTAGSSTGESRPGFPLAILIPAIVAVIALIAAAVVLQMRNNRKQLKGEEDELEEDEEEP